MMQLLLGGSFKKALMQQWVQYYSFVAAAAVFEKRARRCVDALTELNGTLHHAAAKLWSSSQ